MPIEHIGLSVPAPRVMADWYCRHLGFRRVAGAPDSDGVAFIVDDAGETVLEFFTFPGVDPLLVRNFHPLQLHIAIDCAQPYETAMALVQEGAQFVGESPRNAYAGEKILIRDPWGFVLQLVNRQTKLNKKQLE